MFKLMIRELKKNWFQYLSMFVITVLAVTLFLGFISNTLTLRKRSDLYLEESNLADLVLQTSGFDEADEEYLEGLSLNAPVEYRIYSDGEFAHASEQGGAERNAAKVFVSDGAINRPYVVSGETGVLIDNTVAKLHGYAIGDAIVVELTSYKEAFDRVSAALTAQFGAFDPAVKISLSNSYEFTVTGLMYSVEGVNVYTNSPVFLTYEAMAETIVTALSAQLAGKIPSDVLEKTVKEQILPSFGNQALLKCDRYASVKSEIQRRFAEKEDDNLLFVYDRESMESVVILDNEVRQSRNMLYIFPVIFFLVSILVIMTSISRLILRERINIGTFKALGMSNGRIVFHYAFMSAAITFFGCMVGALIGPLIVPAVMTIKYGLIFSMPQLSGVVYSAAWTFGASFVVCALALFIGIWAARSVIRENPAECMRPKQTAYRPHVSRSAGSAKAGSHVVLSFRMAFRNIRINRGRSFMTVIGVLGCSALLVTSFGIGDTMSSSVKNDYGYLFCFDVISPYAAEQETEFFGTLDAMKEDGKIDGYERVTTYVATAQGKANKDIAVYVIPENSAMSRVTEKGNTMSEITASILGVKAGDTVTFALGSCVTQYTVEAIVTTSTWNGFFTTANTFAEDCYGQENIWVDTDDPDGVRDALNEINGTHTAKTMDDRIAEIENMISSTNSMKYTLMVFAVALSVVVLYNLSLLNVKERNRDMATLKVLGFTNFQVALSLMVEILTLTLIGTALGCAVGYPLMWLVMKLNEMATMAFVYSISFASYAASVAVSLGTSIAINAVFGLLISKIDMIESLKSVE